MKALIHTAFLAALVLCFIAPNWAVAQVVSGDTMFVYAMPPGNLNTVISADTSANGTRNPKRVYVLQQTGSVDTAYFVTAGLTPDYPLTIIGKANPTTGYIPVIQPFINADNSSPNNLYSTHSGASLTLKNLFFTGWRTDGLDNMGNLIVLLGDSTPVNIDHCVLDGGNPDYIVVSAKHCTVSITNTEFRDNLNSGCCWVGSQRPIDTLRFVNDTFLDIQFDCFGDLGWIGYLQFEHNTCFMGCWIPLNCPQLWNGVIRNNIFFGEASYGCDSAQIAGYQANPGDNNLGYAVFTLNPLGTLKGAPYNLTEANRNIVFQNNAYYWPAGFYSYWKAVSDTATIPGLITPPVFMDKQTANMFSDHSTWPGLSAANNDSVDPGFSSSLVTSATDSLTKYINLIWTQGTSSGFRPNPLQTDPLNVFGSVPKDWATTQGHPVPENLAYSNRLLGSDGFSLGDLNWYPAQLKLWEEGKANAVTTRPQVPTKFGLSQNYPNPFNPSTEIKVSLDKPGMMSLKIYNVLGQSVITVDEGYKQAGEYSYDVSMDKFATGVYFYTLQQGSSSITKKMLLLK